MSSPCARTQASASCAAVTSFARAIASIVLDESRGSPRSSRPGSAASRRRKSSSASSSSCELRSVPVRKPRPSGLYGHEADAELAHVGRICRPPASRAQSEYSVCSALIGWTACARRIVSGRGLGQPEVADLALRDELGHRADGLLDRRVGVDAVLVVEVDVVDAEAAAATRRRPRARTPASPRMPRDGAVRRRGRLPNFVARTTSSRRPAIARPTSSSFVYGPYMSAVSRSVTPSSSARWIVAIDSASSRGAVELGHAHAAEALTSRDDQALAAERDGLHALDRRRSSALEVKEWRSSLRRSSILCSIASQVALASASSCSSTASRCASQQREPLRLVAVARAHAGRRSRACAGSASRSSGASSAT